MKKAIPTTLLFATALLAGKFDSAVESFQNAPGYVAPIATILGTFSSTGWNHQSTIGKEFTGSISLPVAFVVIADKDREYSDVFEDKIILTSLLPEAEKQARGYKSYTTPTIFGKTPAPTLHKALPNVDGIPDDSTTVSFSDGIADIASFNWLPMPTFQAEFSAYNTSLKLRYLGKPGHDLGIHLPGVGVQHDCGSFLPELPVNLSLFGNFAFPIVNWRPGENITGTLEMRGFSTFTGVSVGREMVAGKLDLMLEAGWEYSKLSTGGELVIYPENPLDVDKIEVIKPDMDLEGRNRFRAGVVIAFNPGKHYRISGGVAVGSEYAYMANPLAFRFGQQNHNDTADLTTDEIAHPVETVPANSLNSVDTDEINHIENETNTTLPLEE